MFNLKDADYHLHTYYSDGEYSPEYVVERFAGLGVKNISITDHDGINGVLEGEKKAIALGMNFRRGIEFSTAYGKEKIEIHMLGYDIDIYNERLLEKIEEIRRKRVKRNNFFIEELEKMGMPVTYDELQVREGQDYLGKPIFARVLLEKGYISTFEEAFSEKVFGSSRMNRVKKEDAPTEEIIELILSAGGIPVLAHPGLIKGIGSRESDEFYWNLDKMIESFKEYGLKGMECFYPKHSMEEEKRFTALAQKYNLYMTKGSDFHNERTE